MIRVSSYFIFVPLLSCLLGGPLYSEEAGSIVGLVSFGIGEVLLNLLGVFSYIP